MDYNLIYFEVSDTGIGIKSENIKNLQIPYNTYDDCLINGTGIGLGLFISQQFIKLLGPLGSLWIESEEKKGSKFSFVLYKDMNSNIE